VRELYERELTEVRRGDVASTYTPKMMDLFKGDLDAVVRSYWDSQKKPVINYEPLYASTKGTLPGSYRSLFGEPNRGAFKDSADFVRSIMSPQFDNRLEHRMIAGSGSLGGVLVPDFLAADVLDRALESEIIRPRANVYNLNAPKISVPGFRSYSHTSNRTTGGFIPVWGAEASTQVAQDATMEVMEMETKYLQLFCNASLQLLGGANGFENILAKAMSDSTSFSLDTAFISGSGVGQPRGLTVDPARLTVTRTSAGTVTYSDCCAMFARMYPPQLANSIWLANSETLPKLLNLTTASGNANYVTQNPVTGKFTLLGRDIIYTEKLPGLGDENDIMLVDLSQYAVALNPIILFDKSASVAWYQGMMAFRVILGADGMGTWTSAVTPKNGAAQSWLVGLK
jgi:HK97 family phage major capsid protein